MTKIACIVTDQTLIEQTHFAFKDGHRDIYVAIGLLERGVKQAETLVEKGYEIFISRGRTAFMIKEALPEVAVVDIPFTVLDVFQTIERSNLHGKRIGVVAFATMILGLKQFGTILGNTIRFYPLENKFEVEKQVKLAIDDEVDVIVGGAITGKFATKYKVPFTVIENSTESLLQAAQEAKNISLAKQQEKTKGQLFKAVLDYTYDGVISVNTKGVITLLNPTAERIIGCEAFHTINKNIQQVWPGIELHDQLHYGKSELAQILSIQNEKVVCNKIPIRVSDIIVGVVINFQEVTQLQQVEAKVRRSLYATGHIASLTFNDIIGSSPQLMKSIALAKDFAKTESSILIQGNTGTGKEVFAQSIHNGSSRQLNPFVAINCAALPEHILESELFGYEGGAFTGAKKKGKAGLFEVAHKGTLFLDEIAEMNYVTQGKLLRVLQEKQVMRLGSDRLTPIDVRIIAATNKPLKSMVNENEFRADLFYRLNVLQLRLYPLREKPKDVEALAQFFLEKHTINVRPRPKFTPNALNELKAYHWPGNVRELQNVIERILATLKGKSITAELVQTHLDDPQTSEINTDLFNIESEEIKQALLSTKGNHTEAAKILGISRTTLWRKLKKKNA